MGAGMIHTCSGAGMTHTHAGVWDDTYTCTDAGMTQTYIGVGMTHTFIGNGLTTCMHWSWDYLHIQWCQEHRQACSGAGVTNICGIQG